MVVLEQLGASIEKEHTSKEARRAEAFQDIFNAISQTAILHAIQDAAIDGRSDDYRIAARDIFNLDSVTCILGGDVKGQIIVLKSEKDLLKQMGISLSTKSQRKKRRCVKLVCVTSADGCLLAVFTILKDDSIKDLQILQLVKTTIISHS